MATKKSNPAKRATPKKKSTARQHAEQRMLRQMNDPSPRVRGTIKEISQGRFPGETPLTGEDRPAARSRGKQHGYRQQRAVIATETGTRTAGKSFIAAPPRKRRNTSRDKHH